MALAGIDLMVQVFALDAFARHDSQRVTGELRPELRKVEGTQKKYDEPMVAISTATEILESR